MPYTPLSLAFVWLVGLAIVGLSASGLFSGGGVAVLVLVALTVPALLLRLAPTLRPATVQRGRRADADKAVFRP